jgi:hypothetical protein
MLLSLPWTDQSHSKGRVVGDEDKKGARRIRNANSLEMTMKMRCLLSRLSLCHLLMIPNQTIPQLIINIDRIPSTNIRRVLFSFEEIPNLRIFGSIGAA